MRMVFKLPKNIKPYTMLLSTLPPAISSNLTSTQWQYCRWLIVVDDKGMQRINNWGLKYVKPN